MVVIKNGNLLDCTEDIIIHQVNCEGVMGGGVARQLALQYPDLEEIYKRHCDLTCNNYNKLKGTIFTVTTADVEKEYKTICNIFSQESNFNTDYEALKKCLEKVKKYAKYHCKSIAIPYKIGCGIANGDWDIVLDIILEVFGDYDITLYKI